MSLLTSQPGPSRTAGNGVEISVFRELIVFSLVLLLDNSGILFSVKNFFQRGPALFHAGIIDWLQTRLANTPPLLYNWLFGHFS